VPSAVVVCFYPREESVEAAHGSKLNSDMKLNSDIKIAVGPLRTVKSAPEDSVPVLTLLAHALCHS
jgi:hypothetical protein